VFLTLFKGAGRGLLTVAHVILGLPGESLDIWNVSAVAEAKYGIKLHPLYVIKGTALEEYARGPLHAAHRERLRT
jgi:radical SAM superfamily enzyme